MTNNKTIMVLVIAAAFVAGTLTTGTIAFAENSFDDKCTKQLTIISGIEGNKLHNYS